MEPKGPARKLQPIIRLSTKLVVRNKIGREKGGQGPHDRILVAGICKLPIAPTTRFEIPIVEMVNLIVSSLLGQRNASCISWAPSVHH